MSVEADFGMSDWVFQASGSQLSWDITWPGVISDRRFAAVSFPAVFVDSQLVRVSEWFSSDNRQNPHIGELIRCNGPYGTAFRFQVVVIPSH